MGKIFLAYLWTETESRSINTQNRRGQCSAILTEQAWSRKDLLYGKRMLLSCLTQKIIPSREDSSILPTQVASHSAGFGSFGLSLLKVNGISSDIILVIKSNAQSSPLCAISWQSLSCHGICDIEDTFLFSYSFSPDPYYVCWRWKTIQCRIGSCDYLLELRKFNPAQKNRGLLNYNYSSKQLSVRCNSQCSCFLRMPMTISYVP